MVGCGVIGCGGMGVLVVDLGVLVVEVQWWHGAVVMVGFDRFDFGRVSMGVVVVVGWVVTVVVSGGYNIDMGLVVARLAWF